MQFYTIGVFIFILYLIDLMLLYHITKDIKLIQLYISVAVTVSLSHCFLAKRIVCSEAKKFYHEILLIVLFWTFQYPQHLNLMLLNYCFIIRTEANKTNTAEKQVCLFFKSSNHLFQLPHLRLP